MAFSVPDLGYAFDALEPHIDARTMEIHHSKHHNTYVVNLNKLLGEIWPPFFCHTGVLLGKCAHCDKYNESILGIIPQH